MSADGRTRTERLPTLWQIHIFVAYILLPKFAYDFFWGAFATRLNMYLGVGYFVLATLANLDRARREGVGVFAR